MPGAQHGTLVCSRIAGARRVEEDATERCRVPWWALASAEAKWRRYAEINDGHTSWSFCLVMLCWVLWAMLWARRAGWAARDLRLPDCLPAAVAPVTLSVLKVNAVCGGYRRHFVLPALCHQALAIPFFWGGGSSGALRRRRA
jgi:hypothetical protein